ncbi:hypothetical protein PoB_003769800 [Plakobranchus ocellatus]|uniref:Uncharacterized protein n=1 Tax=Plakobranchus ocellatus TaxID=259542 RepID=A0AAV4AWH2_9GAST|nr:hypothetical protein PoB_003769800 [Plakobranchus ocellatus]
MKKEKKYEKAAPAAEQTDLQALWRDLKARHSALSRVDSAKKNSKPAEENRRKFLQRPVPARKAAISNNQDQAP